MCADRNLKVAAPNPVQSFAFLSCTQNAFDQPNLVLERAQHTSKIKVMLFGQDFSGGHERNLKTVFDGYDCRLGSHNGLSRAYVSLQKATHRSWGTHIVGDLLQDPFLRRGRMEREDLLDPGSYAFSNPDLAAFHKTQAMLTDHVDSDLKLKKLLEDQTLVRHRHHLI